MVFLWFSYGFPAGLPRLGGAHGPVQGQHLGTVQDLQIRLKGRQGQVKCVLFPWQNDGKFILMDC